MRRRWRILGRYKHLINDVTVTQSWLSNSEPEIMRFTATICGWRNWKIWQGHIVFGRGCFVWEDVKKKIEVIKKRILDGDEKVFYEPNEYNS